MQLSQVAGLDPTMLSIVVSVFGFLVQCALIGGGLIWAVSKIRQTAERAESIAQDLKHDMRTVNLEMRAHVEGVVKQTSELSTRLTVVETIMRVRETHAPQDA